MKKFGLLGTSSLCSAALLALAAAGPAHAQAIPIPPAGTAPQGEEVDPNASAEPETEAQAANDEDDRDTITVTGSRIVRPETSGVLPGVQVDQEQIQTRGFTNALDIVNDVPLTGTGANPTGNNGGQPTALGASFIDLLDLGTARTLVLINGRRTVGGNAATLFTFGNETGSQTDVNSIPTLLIERVDVVTVGGAAAYGTDAIAGVVNYILRDDFEGLDVSAISNITDRGDGFGYNLRAIGGQNFGGDRGNVVLNLEYARVDAINGVGRSFISDNPLFISGFNNGGVRDPAFAAAIPSQSAFLPAASDLAPGSLSTPFARSLASSYGGNIFELSAAAAGLPAQNRVAANPGAQTFISGVSQLVPGTAVAAAQAGCSITNLTGFCTFAPNALPAGTAAQQTAFANAVVARFAPTLATHGTQAERNVLAVNLLQANRPTPREFFAQNPSVPVNAFVGQFIPGFVDVQNNDTRPVTINGATVPLNTVLPRVAVPLRFDDAGNVMTFDSGSLTPTQPSTLTGSTSREGFFDPTAQVVRVQQDRYIANFNGRFDITDGVTFFTENLYANVRAFVPRTVATANAVTGTALETGALILNVNNPFLDNADRAALNQFGINPTTRNGNFVLSRVNQDILGDAPSDNRAETYRLLGGLRGEFGRNQNWEVAAAYGRSDLRTKGFSLLDVEFALAIDTVRNASGQIVCRSQVDPTAAQNLSGVQTNIVRVAGPDGLPTEQLLTPTATADQIARCQPLNPFGFNQMSEASKDYVTARLETRNRSEQLFFQGLLSGDLFDLPGGGVQYALSAEYRQDELALNQDDIQRLGRSRNAPTSPTAGQLKTLEGGAELRIPIFGEDFNLPLFRSLEFNPAVRVTRQRGSAPAFRNLAGTVIEPEYRGDFESIYSLAGTWQPIRDFTVRGNYTRSLRQPNIVELFLTNQSAFAATLDPCSNQRIGFATNPDRRRANCAALVVSTGLRPDTAQALQFLNTFRSTDVSQPVAFAGNTNLSPEEGKSYTVGAILQPRFLRRFSLSADYINLELENQIIPTNPTQAAEFCVDSETFPDTTPQFGTNLCAFIPRSAADFQVQPGAAGQFLNLSATKLEGVNISGNFAFNLPSDAGRITLRSNAFHLIRFDTSANGRFTDRQQSAGSFTRPKWEAVSSVRYDRNDFYTQLTHRYQEGTTLFSGGVPATIELAEFFRYPALNAFDYSIGYDDEESGFRAQLAITNLTDETFAGQTGLFNAVNFDTLGRRYQVAVGLRF